MPQIEEQIVHGDPLSLTDSDSPYALAGLRSQAAQELVHEWGNLTPVQRATLGNWPGVLSEYLRRGHWALSSEVKVDGTMGIIGRATERTQFAPTEAELAGFAVFLLKLDSDLAGLQKARLNGPGLTEPSGELGVPAVVPPPSLSIDYASLVLKLRAQHLARPALLLEYMTDREAAAYQDVAERVHIDGTVGDDAIRKNVGRLNRELEALGVPLRFKVASKHVHKEILPA